MFRSGEIKGQNLVAKGRIIQPQRHFMPKNSPVFSTRALAGDNEYAAPPRSLLRGDEGDQGMVGVGLPIAVQIQGRLDREFASAQPRGRAAVDACRLSVRQHR